MSRDEDRYKGSPQARREKLRRVGGAPPLDLLRNPRTAERVVEHGFASGGVWSPQSAVPLQLLTDPYLARVAETKFHDALTE